MQKHTLVAVSMAALIAAVIAWNSLGAEALPIIDEAAATPLAEKRVAAEGKPVIVPSIRLWPHPQVLGSSAGGLLYRLDGGRHGLPSTSRGPEATNTPASPLPAPTNTPAAPVGDAGATLERLPSARTVTATENASPSNASAEELLPETDDHPEQTWQRAATLRQAAVRFDLPDGGTRTIAGTSPQSTSEETCVDVLLNPQLDVVEFGDGTGSIEYWSILFQKVYYSTETYNSPSYSLVLVDESDGTDPDLVEIGGEIWDYDEFGQGFVTPANLTRIRVSFSSVYADPNVNDEARSWLYTLTSEGYLDEWIAWVEIPGDSTAFEDWYWELTASEYPDLLAALSGRPVAAVYDMLSDTEAPSEWLWLDDLQVTLCYQRGQYRVYLPLVEKKPAAAPPPTCSPREPDSVSQPGSTTVDVTCSGSFNQVDQKDYYALDLKGISRVRLRLFNLPQGTNWDALIYENKSNYPLACQIGTKGDADKAANCELSPSKNYFVLVSEGENGTVGPYSMRVEERR